LNEAQAIAALRQALNDDPDLAPFAERITLQAGDPWRIDGEVGNIAAKRKAVRVARRVLPGIELEDCVTLERSKRRSDQALAEVLREALRAEPAFAKVPIVEPGSHPPPYQEPWIGVIVRDGAIYLGGRLSLAGKSLAEGLAWETGACCDVKNLINHEAKTLHLDEDVAEAVRTLIAEHPRLGTEPIEVAVKDGEVTLQGRVADADQRNIATSLCWFAPTVRVVHDRLKVR
jgi:osmotically-inducible protein OsmY